MSAVTIYTSHTDDMADTLSSSVVSGVFLVRHLIFKMPILIKLKFDEV